MLKTHGWTTQYISFLQMLFIFWTILCILANKHESDFIDIDAPHRISIIHERKRIRDGPPPRPKREASQDVLPEENAQTVRNWFEYVGKCTSMENGKRDDITLIVDYETGEMVGVTQEFGLVTIYPTNVVYPLEDDSGNCLSFDFVVGKDDTRYRAALGSKCKNLWVMLLKILTGPKSFFHKSDQFLESVSPTAYGWLLNWNNSNPSHYEIEIVKNRESLNWLTQLDSRQNRETQILNVDSLRYEKLEGGRFDAIEGLYLSESELKPFRFEGWPKVHEAAFWNIQEYLGTHDRMYSIHRILPVEGKGLSLKDLTHESSMTIPMKFSTLVENGKLKKFVILNDADNHEFVMNSTVEVLYEPEKEYCLRFSHGSGEDTDYFLVNEYCDLLFLDFRRLAKENPGNQVRVEPKILSGETKSTIVKRHSKIERKPIQ